MSQLSARGRLSWALFAQHLPLFPRLTPCSRLAVTSPSSHSRHPDSDPTPQKFRGVPSQVTNQVTSTPTERERREGTQRRCHFWCTRGGRLSTGGFPLCLVGNITNDLLLVRKCLYLAQVLNQGWRTSEGKGGRAARGGRSCSSGVFMD